jgi:Flp pilus assembly protein TadD
MGGRGKPSFTLPKGNAVNRIRFFFRQAKGFFRGRVLGVATGFFLLFLSASSVQGAHPFRQRCPADPPPAAAWAAVWFPRDPDAALAAGRELLARGDYPAALCYLQLAERGHEDDPGFLSDLGLAYWETGASEQAIAQWEAALRADPESDSALGGLWKVYKQTRQWEKAEGALWRWLARHPDDAEAKFALALIRAAQEPGSALDLLDELESAPAHIAKKAQRMAAVIRAAIAYRNPAYIFASTGQELLRLDEPELAEVALLRAVERDPNFGEAYALLGLAREYSGEDPEEAYKKGVALAPQSALACLLYGSWLRRQGKLDLARWWLMQAWNARPGDWNIAAELSQVDFLLGNLDSAESWVLQAVEAHPQEEGAWLALAAFYINNDFMVAEKGIPAARQAVFLAPDDDRAVDLLGLGWYEVGDFNTAERMFRRALELNPDSASAHLHLGMCLREQGRSAEARLELEAAFRLDPDGPLGAQAKTLLGEV